jgi:hypothetical protein
MQARTLIEVRRFDEVEGVVEAGLGFLVGLPEEETAEVAAQLAALRVEAAAADVLDKAEAKVRSAERELRFAKDDIEKGYVMSSAIDYRFDRAREYLENVPDEMKAPLLEQADMLQAILVARDGGTPAAAAPPSTPAAPAVSEEDQVKITRARRTITQARSWIESRRTEGVDGVLDEAVESLAGVAEAERAPLLAEVEALRAEIVNVEKAEYARRIESEFGRHLRQAENVEPWQPQYSARALEYLDERMAEEKERGSLDPEILAGYEARIAAAIVNRAAVLKANALERAMPRLEEFEGRVASDPFEGLDNNEAYRVTGELDSLRYRAQHELADQPEDDPDVMAFNARIAAVNEKIEKASQAWATVQLHNSVRESWAIIERNEEIAGWREETADPEPRLLEVPQLNRTRTTIMRIGSLLAERETKEVRAENPDDEFIQSTYRRAEEERDAAVAKLAQAYEFVLAEAEKVETPLRIEDRQQAGHFSTAVSTSFEGTSALEGLLARTKSLEDRWEAEVEAIMQARQELYDRLAVEADAVWPEIVASTGATDDFDPGDTSAAGKTVHLQGVYNRSGWDFKNYDFCMRWDGIPVGGSYEPYVQQALEHAWYHLKLDVNDRITWDLVAVVQGHGKIGERTQISVKGSNGLEIGKVEEWPAVECVRLKIIALHAGAVAVGPDHEWHPTA